MALEAFAGHLGPFAGHASVLTTKHGKLDVIAPPLVSTGLSIDLAELDTDTLGTFSGDVPRPGPPLETAVRKARLGMEARGVELGLASEGSVGPHPAAPWIVVDRELVVLVDDRRGTVVAGRAASADIVGTSTTARPGDDVGRLLARADVPTHAVVVVPNLGPPSPAHKGLRHAAEVGAAVERCAAVSPDGLARIETDLRAHCCPSRRAVIRAAAVDLAGRLLAGCPRCGTPGWGRADVVSGLPCSWCGTEVDRVRAELYGCVSCPHTSERPLSPERKNADPGECPSCNP